MRKIIECVPNISEGRDLAKVDKIVKEYERYATVLNVESDPDHNRSVITIAGDPVDVVISAYSGIKKAAELIDMSKHKGTHSRIGATDIVPFIPLENMTMGDCKKCAELLGEDVALKLNIPVYLYGEAANQQDRVLQSNIRKGQYEGLEKKMQDPLWQPDFNAPYNKKAGATIIGAREILIAYNIYLDSTDIDLAKDIGKAIKEKDGGFKGIQAMGMHIDSLGCTQVSMNIRDYKVTSMLDVFDEVNKLSGGIVNGSEVIGVLPKKALTDIADVMIAGSNDEEVQINYAMHHLQLERFNFEPEKEDHRIYGEVKMMDLDKILDEIESTDPAMGIGAGAATTGIIAASMLYKVASKSKMDDLILDARATKENLKKLIELDKKAYENVVKAYKSKDKEKIDDALAGAIETPIFIAGECLQIIKYSELALSEGKKSMALESYGAALNAKTAIDSVGMIAEVNIDSMDDNTKGKKLLDYMQNIRRKASKKMQDCWDLAQEKIYS